MSSTSPPNDAPIPPEFLQRIYELPHTCSNQHPSLRPDDEGNPDAHEHVLPTLPPPPPNATRPYVTLTFAQSLDAKIAGAHGRPLALSGKQSMLMTHWMRTLHDAILVGVGTALNDDPQLNVRHLPALPPDCTAQYNIPRPVVLDTRLRVSPQCKLLKNYAEGRGRRPWIICRATGWSPEHEDDAAWTARKEALIDAGAQIIEVRADRDEGAIPIDALLATLRGMGIRSLMVEGGARVIQSFLTIAGGPARDDPSETRASIGPARAVDMVVVTIAPTFVGGDGVGYGSDLLVGMTALQHVETELFGCDAVVALKTRS